MQQQDSDARVQLKRRYGEFLDEQHGSWNLSDAVSKLYSNGDDGKPAQLLHRRLIIPEHHIRDFDPKLLQELQNNPSEHLLAFEDALKENLRSGRHDPGLLKLLGDHTDIHIGLKGDFGRHEVSPRELTSALLGKLVCVFGIVTKCSVVRPKVAKSVHYCEATKAFTTMEYRDVTALSGLPTSAVYPNKDSNGNHLTTEYGMCTYKDSQTITMQELPEIAPPGQLPHSADVILDEDLADSTKPGDRVCIIGVYKAVSSKVSGPVSGVCKAVVVGVSVHKLTKESQVKFTVDEAILIRNLAKRKDVLDLLSRSLAPSILGHDIIKQGLILQLFGGFEKNLSNGTHLRGDINCLLVGVSSEKRLEAGAMVLADRGLVCIDEFDKMSDQDRVAIHEVMEQQTVTIAKAGIHTSLNARCSVLAAANPLYGSYDKSISVTRNVNLPDSLLSRFDMLFVVLDCMNESQDRMVAKHVIAQHRFRPTGEDGKGATMQETLHDRRLSMDAESNAEPQVFMKHDTRLHGGSSKKEVLTSEYLRKFIIYVRRRYVREGVQIFIEDDAAQAIVDYYSELRRLSKDRALPVTARTLETIIRIATASCKIGMRFAINEADVAVARSILDHCLRNNVGEEDDLGDEDGRAGGPGDDGMDEDNDDDGSARRGRRQTRRQQQADAQEDDSAGCVGKVTRVLGGNLIEQQVAVVSDAIQSLADEFKDGTIPVDELQVSC
ncbi:MCM2/3/5 family-domain-containing protein [Dunaliella salina]|uniref:DNA replication licensing factor MCM3 n=1 Tax=Dunaliella salina TaxID=3046 RepID=A0ABQ7G5X7_DUNSA|nr:MCM2/3/5 family-domain-containing protein [Dunaliella salina]|eukprot:KAF5830011.1 MCM2/3/5 family-domain-containing protein [Dunaliella salina]